MAVTNNDSNGILRINEADSKNQQQEENKPSRSITNKLDLLDTKLDNLYKSVYISRPDNRHNMEDIINSLDDSIDRLQSNELSVSGMSELLRRLDKENSKGGNKQDDFFSSIQEMISDGNFMNTLYTNSDVHKYIQAQNYNYDMLCKFVPKVMDALELKRDNVLCADNFTKRFLNPTSSKSSKIEVQKFTTNCRKLERKYDLDTFYSDTYMNVSKYGEDFIYIVPYKIAFERLLKRQNLRKTGSRLSQLTFMSEGVSSDSQKPQSVIMLQEGFGNTNDFKNYIKVIKEQYDIQGGFSEIEKNFEGYQINIHFNDSNVIPDRINEAVVIREKSQLDRFASIASMHEAQFDGYTDIDEEDSDTISEAKEYNSVFNDVGKIKNSPNTFYNDGLLVPGSLGTTDRSKDPSKLDDNFVGAVLERIPREDIIPAYIGDKCLGYYYFEFKDDPSACGFCGGHHTAYGISNAQYYAYKMTEDQQELAMRYICTKISQTIDTHFINSNKDLSEEIYAVLRYNDKFSLDRANDIGVTFIPAEDIIHCYFKLNPLTHRGISDLERSLVPGMMYMLLYLSDIIGKITRSVDKRVYYVKQNIETNVARTMMNVVQQIKKGSRKAFAQRIA